MQDEESGGESDADAVASDGSPTDSSQQSDGKDSDTEVAPASNTAEIDEEEV